MHGNAPAATAAAAEAAARPRYSVYHTGPIFRLLGRAAGMWGADDEAHTFVDMIDAQCDYVRRVHRQARLHLCPSYIRLQSQLRHELWSQPWNRCTTPLQRTVAHS